MKFILLLCFPVLCFGQTTHSASVAGGSPIFERHLGDGITTTAPVPGAIIAGTTCTEFTTYCKKGSPKGCKTKTEDLGCHPMWGYPGEYRAPVPVKTTIKVDELPHPYLVIEDGETMYSMEAVADRARCVAAWNAGIVWGIRGMGVRFAIPITLDRYAVPVIVWGTIVSRPEGQAHYRLWSNGKFESGDGDTWQIEQDGRSYKGDRWLCYVKDEECEL